MGLVVLVATDSPSTIRSFEKYERNGIVYDECVMRHGKRFNVTPSACKSVIGVYLKEEIASLMLLTLLLLFMIA